MHQADEQKKSDASLKLYRWRSKKIGLRMICFESTKQEKICCDQIGNFYFEKKFVVVFAQKKFNWTTTKKKQNVPNW